MVQKRQSYEGNLSKRNALVNKTINDFSFLHNLSMHGALLQLDESIFSEGATVTQHWLNWIKKKIL